MSARSEQFENVQRDDALMRRRHLELSWRSLATARQKLTELGVGWWVRAETGTAATLAPNTPSPHVVFSSPYLFDRLCIRRVG